MRMHDFILTLNNEMNHTFMNLIECLVHFNPCIHIESFPSLKHTIITRALLKSCSLYTAQVTGGLYTWPELSTAVLLNTANARCPSFPLNSSTSITSTSSGGLICYVIYRKIVIYPLYY